MFRTSLIGGCLGAAGLLGATLHAGGWALVTLDTVPDLLVAGTPTSISFMVRQHGIHPVDGLSPVVEATSGTRLIKADAVPTGRTGQYSASLTLDRPGDWTIGVRSGFGTSRLTLLPLAVVAPGEHPVAPSPVERGRLLFVGKGCVTCHRNDLRTDTTQAYVGPDLVPGKYQAEYLARALANPAIIAPRPDSAFRMPNLGLSAAEIESLVAYLNSPVSTTAVR
jgi:mono/diheme cytochrome c family protein